MIVHILRPDATAFSLNRQAAYVGFIKRGAEVQFFDADAQDTLLLDPEDIVVGGIGIVHGAFSRLGWSIPALPSVPPELSRFAGRKVWRGPLIDARREVERGRQIFVKPLPEEPKRFAGQALTSFADLIATAHIPDETVVECAEIVPFVSEYRCFVLAGDVIGVRPYTGDPLRFPDPAVIREAVAAFPSAPRAYALDVGVTEDGQTLLVEVNDAYALGAYGLAPVRYAALI
ncbi:MAG: ATP-grasp domain-containing protein, partial [Pseudomonadota bacterium]